MKSRWDTNTDLTARIHSGIDRRTLLGGALTAGGLFMLGAAHLAVAQENDEPESGPTPVALALARALNRLKFADIPPTPIKYAKMLLASTLASAASGAMIGSARIVRDLLKEQGGRPDATVWFDGAKLPIASAARVNGMASAAAASDDSDMRNVAHTGTTLTGVGLAIGEQTGATGTDILSAMVLGYEAAGRIGDALAGGRKGFHASVIVAFGGVVAAARLLRLTDEQMANAIGITATTMGGLGIGTNSWAREYYDGNVALCVVNAALAAGRGYTVNKDMLEAPRGFLTVFGDGKFDRQRLTRDAGPDWDIAKYMAVKLAPGAHAYLATAEAAVNAARQAAVPPEEVAQILVAGPQSRAVTGRQRPPEDMVEAVHSLPFFVASAVADKDYSWASPSPEKFHRPVVARLMELVAQDPAPPAVHYPWSWGSTVTVVTKSGARYASTVEAPRGSAPRGIEWSDVDAKYRALMPDSGLSPKRIEETLRVIHDFDQVKHVSEFTRLIRAS